MNAEEFARLLSRSVDETTEIAIGCILEHSERYSLCPVCIALDSVLCLIAWCLDNDGRGEVDNFIHKDLLERYDEIKEVCPGHSPVDEKVYHRTHRFN